MGNSNSIKELTNVGIPFYQNHGRLRQFELEDKSKFIYFPDVATKGENPNLYQIRNDSIFKPPEWLDMRERISHVVIKGNQVFVSTIRGLFVCTKEKRDLWLKEMYCSETRYVTGKGLWVTTLANGLIFFPNPKYTIHKNTEIGFSSATQIKSINDKLYIATNSGKILRYTPDEEYFDILYEVEKSHPIEKLDFDSINQELIFINELNNIFYNISNHKIRTFNTPAFLTPLNQDVFLSSLHTLSFFDFTQGDSLSNLTPKYIQQKNIGKKRHTTVWNDKGVHPRKIILTADRPYSYFQNEQDTTFWVATRNQLLHFKRERIDTITYENKPIISTSIKMEENGSVWAATSTGVLQIQGDSVIQKLDEPNILRHQNITHLRKKNNHLYLISNGVLQQYNIQTQKLKLYNELDGLPKGKVNDVEELNGFIYVGMDKGLVRIPLEDDALNKLVPIARISEVFINEIPFGKPVDDIKLDYYENNIRIDISAIALQSQGQHSYQYRFKGVDEEWTELLASSKSIRFPNLSHGFFEFQVKVLNNDGIESEIKSLKIRISPPFWKTWWFILSSVLGFGIITALIVYLRFQIVNERLKLEKALKNSEMKAIRAQMNPH
ncbi:MAG: triple tyrosine motif-containing protein, partial [Saprospiraceae bacterium]